MTEAWLEPVDFDAYLEAKIEVDDRSLHPRLFSAVCGRIRSLESPRILDVGTGTGAMLRRLLGRAVGERGELVGLDPEGRSLTVASRRIARELETRGHRVEVGPRTDKIGFTGSAAVLSAGALGVRLVCGGLLEDGLSARPGGRRFDVVTAHAFLDLLPIEAALRAIRGLLRPGGWLYATINYDGLTALLPPYGDPEFERRLLECYDRSMEKRLAGGKSTGGRFSGRRLCRTLPGCGYAIRDVGPSDWMVFPGPRGHSRGRRTFLRTLLAFIAGEGLGATGLEPERLDPASVRRWYAQRLEAVDGGKLALMTHQLDVLAQADRAGADREEPGGY
ncbi:MAG: class I SAM-dependent methyltransferase [Spirochaetales bacterium]|nr:class I SAM-dependent methyltransferase [Spirochaetales bacterium]